MSYSQDPKEGYTKLANIKQGGGQHVEIYVPDTRRKMSPEAQARALARSEIKEQYKAAALAEEVKAIKKQRNKLVDNLAKVGKSPSFVADIPPVNGLSGTPKTYVDTPTSPTTTTTASTPSKSKSQVGNLNYQVGNLNYSAPIGPLPSSSMGGFKNKPYDNRINYSQPIGPTQGPGLGMSFNRNRNYSAPIGPAPGPDMGGFQDRPYDQQINYSQPIGPRGTPNNRRMSSRTPSSSGRMVEYQGRDEPINGGRNQQGNYNDYVDDGDQPRRSGLPSPGRVAEYKDDAKPGSISQQDTSKWTPEMLLPGKTLAEVEAVYKQRKASAVKKGRTKLARALDRAIVIRRKQFGTSGKITQTTPGRTPGRSPTGQTPLPTDVEKNAELLLPGKTEQAVRRVHAERRAAAVKKGNKELVARLDRALPVRLQRLKSQGANVFKVSPERLLPGKTLPEVEAAYKQRRASAVSKGRTALVQALDRAIALRRKQLGGSPGKSPQSTPGKSPSNLSKIPPERLIPGKNLAEVEATYKNRRASAVAKKRIALVQALDRAIGIRRKQFGGPSGKVPTSPGKVPSSPSKTPLPSGKEWKDVFGPVDMSNPNPRAVSEKYQALRRKTKDEDVSKLNALFKKAIIDIKLIKRQRASQESKSAQGAKAKMEADKARVEAEKAKAKSAEVKKSIDREIISTKRKIRDVSIKAKKASANIDRAGKEMSAATARRDTRKAEKLTRFTRKRQQNLRSAQEVRGKLITSLKGLEQKSAKVSPLMLTQGSPNPMARQSAQQQSVQQQKSSQIQAKAQSFLAEKARAQSAKIEQSGKQMVIKAAQDKMQSAKAQSAKVQSAKLEQDKRQKSAKAQSAKAQSAKLEQEKRQKSAKLEQDTRPKSALAEKARAQSAKLEQEKRQKSAKIEQDKRLQSAKAQSAKAQSAKMEQIKKAQTSQKRQMSQARPPMKVMRPRRR